MTSSSLKKLKEKSLNYYRSIGNIYCPYLKKKVNFNSKGFYHILHKKKHGNKERSIIEQVMRLKLLPLVTNLLSITTTVQELEINHGKYWGFVAVIDAKKIKVIVKEGGDGELYFLSVIPNWVTRKKSDIKKNTR